jgi:uncharacterized membrane protein (UPF0182 family)
MLLLLIVASQIVDLWTDRLWFSEVGYTAVFGGLLRTKVLLFALFGGAFGGFLGGNLYLAFRIRPLLLGNSPEQEALDRYRTVLSPRLGLWTSLVGTVVGLFAGLSGEGHWQQWMLFRTAATSVSRTRSTASTSASTCSGSRSTGTCWMSVSPRRR